jgi:hypothetical protein
MLFSGALLAYAKAMRMQGYLGRFGQTVSIHQFMLNFPASKVTLLWIPKNSCTAVKRMLLEFEPQELQAKTQIAAFHESVQRLFGVSVPQFCEHVRFPLVAIVRHPLERLVSCYLDKFAMPVVRDGPFEPFIENHIAAVHRIAGLRGTDIRRSITFSEFVFYISTQAAWAYDAHWRPQSNFLWGLLNKTKLIPTERLFEIRELLGLGSSLHFSNRSAGKRFDASRPCSGEFAELLPRDLKQEQIENYNQFVSSSLANFLNDVYRDDFSLYALATNSEYSAADHRSD